MNAISPETVRGLAEALNYVRLRQKPSAVLGSAGGNLKFFRRTLGAGKRNSLMDFFRHLQAMMQRLGSLPISTIAATNGVAVASSLELALCYDLIVASDTVGIGDGHTNFGIIPAEAAAFACPAKCWWLL